MGYVKAYPRVFGLSHGSSVSLMMDRARGGYFPKVPRRYPRKAWYTYYDRTCDYTCQITEYLYWAMTTILGAQRYRHEEIRREWRPYTRANIERIDKPIFELLTDPRYKLPKILPTPMSGAVLYADNRRDDTTSDKKYVCCCGCFGSVPDKLKEKLKQKLKP